MGDFLKQDVQTPLRASYVAAGIRFGIETNSETVLEAAGDNLDPADPNAPDIRLRIWVEDLPNQGEACLTPYFRGLGQFVFSSYGEQSSLLVNLRDRRGAGRLTRALVRREEFWKTIFFPSILAILAPSVGLTSLHSACVAFRGRGMLLVGDSSAGKSTLSLALCRAGFDFLCDDRTLLGRREGELQAWALSPEMKQRPESLHHFPELRRLRLTSAPDGDSVFRFDPALEFGIQRIRACRPAWIVFLEREPEPLFSLREITADESTARLQAGLHRESDEATEDRRRILEELVTCPGYVLRHGGDPRATAGALQHAFLRGSGTHKAASNAVVPQVPRNPTDPLRRFRTTRLRTDVQLMGRHLRIETDSPSVISRVAELFDLSEPVPVGTPGFLWRIALEKPDGTAALWPSMTAFSDGSLRYIGLKRQGFLAADLAAHEAVGSLPEPYSRDTIGFATVFLAGMLHLSAPALGLTPVSAACVARQGRGLLLFGPAESGKTTASYWASKQGMDFHADQATFLETSGSEVVAWGDFWPAAFRPGTARYLPELSAIGRPFRYGDRDFLCIDKGAGPPANRGRVTAAACVFLERSAASPPRLIPLSAEELRGQTVTDAGSSVDSESIFGLLCRLPAYRLQYGDDPRVASLLFRSVLDADRLMEPGA